MATASTSSPHITLEPYQLKRWTVDEYHRLSDLALIEPSERTELISGQITLMVAKGTPHVTALQLLSIEIDKFLLSQPFYSRTQDPIELDDFSEPEPDLVIVKGNVLDYAQQHPQPQDVCLIVEVADTTLQHDCQVKDKLYAQARISEYWVLDLPHRQLHIYQKPTQTGYSSHLILTEDNQVSPSAFPELSLAVSALLPPLG